MNRVFFILGLCLSSWSFGYLGISISGTEDVALYWLVLPKIFVPFILPTFLLFSLIITENYKGINRKICVFGYIFSLIIVTFDLKGEFIVQGVKFVHEYGFYFTVVGRFHPLFDLASIFFTGYGMYLLGRRYKITKDIIEKSQLRCLLVGVSIGLLGVTTNVLLELGIRVYPLGHLAKVFYNLVIIYAIGKYRLML